MPSSMPAGTSTVIVRRARTRPSVPQAGHGVGICWPVPAHAVHARVVMTWPRNERCTDCSSPDPPQVAQVRGDVPGAQPEPWHCLAQDRRLDRDLAAHAERGLVQRQRHLQQRVGAGTDAAAARGAARHRRRRRRTPRTRRRTRRTPRTGCRRCPRPARADRRRGRRCGASPGRRAPRRRADLLEPLGGARLVVHVRVVLAGQATVRTLDLLGRRVLANAEQPVVVVR